MMKIISRKERRIQKALGTEEGMPPTIGARIKWLWWNHITARTYKWGISEFWQWLAFKLPKGLVYHCAIRVWVHATTCSSGCNEIVTDTTMDNAIKRWEKNSGRV